MAKAVGLLEVYGFATALYAVDAACKASNVVIETMDKNKPAPGDDTPVPLLVMLKIRGSVADVSVAIETGKKAANEISGYVLGEIIPHPDENLEKLLGVNCL